MRQMARIAEIEAASSDRSLTSEELDELERLQSWRDIRIKRRARQIAACQAKLQRLHNDLAALT